MLLVAGAVALVLAYSWYTYTHPKLSRLSSDPRAYGSVSFFALGDQGTGGITQWRIAHAMEIEAEKYQALDFVILLGDNFYSKEKLTINSHQWMSKFENVYSGKYLNAVPFYAVLGNHDHGKSEGKDDETSVANTQSSFAKTGVEAQLEYSIKHLGSNRWRMPARYFSRDFGRVGEQPLIRIVYLDTNLGHEDLLKEADFIREQFSTKENVPIWRFVAGHHPIKTFGKHYGETAEYEEVLLPALQASDVDVYMSGHDHNQQVIARENEPYYLVSGGGGADTYSIKKRPTDLIFAKSTNGFMGVRVDKSRLDITAYDASGEILASFEVNRDCHQNKSGCLKQKMPEKVRAAE